MVDADLDKLREQKREQLRNQRQEQAAQQEQSMKADLQMDALVKRYLEEDARTRLNNVKLVNRSLYGKVVQTVMYLVQSQKLTRKMKDVELKKLLNLAAGEKKDIKIIRKG